MEFNSPREYVDIFMGIIEEEGRFDEDFLEMLKEAMYEKTEQTFRDYMLGNREHYVLDEQEFDEIVDQVGIVYTKNLIDGMIDKGVFEGVVTPEGEMMYRLTEYGKNQVDLVKRSQNL